MVAVGEPVTSEDFDMIMNAVAERQAKFPEESGLISMGLVFANVGDRFTPVTCEGEEEWTGMKGYINPPEDGPPLCPNGHELTVGATVKLGWISVE